jgi:hypothetical protein
MFSPLGPGTIKCIADPVDHRDSEVELLDRTCELDQRAIPGQLDDSAAAPGTGGARRVPDAGATVPASHGPSCGYSPLRVDTMAAGVFGYARLPPLGQHETFPVLIRCRVVLPDTC